VRLIFNPLRMFPASRTRCARQNATICILPHGPRDHSLLHWKGRFDGK
jgi:hypothetical protein